MTEPRESEWTRAILWADREVLAELLSFVQRYTDQQGRAPTVEEVLTHFRGSYGRRHSDT